MKETTPAAMPPCFDRWCQRFDNVFSHVAHKRELRNYLTGLLGEKSKTVWVAHIEVEIPALSGSRNIAIVMNDSSFDKAEEIDYLITNIDSSIITPEWIVRTYGQRNWIEVFSREAKGWLGLKEYQVRSQRSLERHFI